MTPGARKQLEEMAGSWSTSDTEAAFMDGAQAAWEMRDAELKARLESASEWLNTCVQAERDRCANSADLMQADISTGETWIEALARHKHRVLNPQGTEGVE